MKPETEILLSAAFALTPEENWTTRVFAKDSRGFLVDPTDPSATCFCMRGAIYAAAKTPLFSRAEQVARAEEWLLRAIGGSTPGDAGAFNNTHTHAQVLAALYKAAELAEAS